MSQTKNKLSANELRIQNALLRIRLSKIEGFVSKRMTIVSSFLEDSISANAIDRNTGRWKELSSVKDFMDKV